MTRLRTIGAATLLALAFAACYGEKASNETAAAAPAAENDAQRAARIANALTAAPDKTDSILSATGLNADQLEQLMYKVARDSTMSDEYARLTAR